MVKVKICGITNLEDALHAERAGADALGFNFYSGSPRRVEPAFVSSVVKLSAESVVTVGVFVNESIENVVAAAAASGISAIQLHGDESPEYVEHLSSATGLQVIKAFRISPSFRPEEVLRYGTDMILLDAFSADGFGGTGEIFEWNHCAPIRSIFPAFYLAGGLGPDNVREAVERVKPFGVDACSRLESAKGKKDPKKVTEFIKNARSL
jgi:phosphoribosylanthranilate isomerase